MAWKEKPIQKLYWSIGEVCAELHVAASLIRFWCKQFGLLHKRNHHNDRMFTEADRITLREIYFLLKVEKYTIPGAKRKMHII